jgi:hypothetical protein
MVRKAKAKATIYEEGDFLVVYNEEAPDEFDMCQVPAPNQTSKAVQQGDELAEVTMFTRGADREFESGSPAEVDCGQVIQVVFRDTLKLVTSSKQSGVGCFQLEIQKVS